MARRTASRHDRAERRRERLDPIRWGRPGRGSLVRMIVAAVLLLTSAAALWYQPAARTPAAPGPASPAAPAPSGPVAEPDAAGIPPGKVGVPVRLADPTALTLVRPGQRVDLLRPGDRGTPVASAALVLEVTGAGDPAAGGLLLALSPEEAELAVAISDQGFAILIRPG
ncbi:hypothetical protein ACTI_15440 [Actinoplanes sp. OR16]|uniref:hypothetical protein n=1 Tax=Actinoplanes sp. OR16 TaxID=946334 RepID=UPI000F6E3176|nr:hypothetical protein [Actinoplanes sp. OR16]BBH64859.1 hypothetical protein ACTI_15440 [Actinoplanes sp. OR16]